MRQPDDAAMGARARGVRAPADNDSVTVMLALDGDMLAMVDDRAAKAGRDRQEMLHLLLRIGLSASVNPMEPGSHPG